MKHKLFKKDRSTIWKIVGGLILLIIVSCQMTIDSIVQPASVNGGDILSVTLNVKIISNQDQTSRFMVAVLVPKVWKASQPQNTTITFVSDITTGPQPMTLIPTGTAAPNGNGLDWPTYLNNKIGNGGNRLSDYEWVAFYSNSAYTVNSSSNFGATVSIQMKTSPDNLLFKLGYCIANSSDGLSSSDRYGAYLAPTNSCFQVIGTGDLIDFCNPQLSTIDPRNSLDNDIITVNFDGGVASTDLDNAAQVYLCATGITTTGDILPVCVQTDKTKMTSLGLNRWQKDIWPRSLFNLNANQHLARLEYYFTDASGNKKVGYGNGSGPFTYTFKCQ